MNKKIFVGGLSWGTEEEGLRQSFTRFGNIEDVRIITDRETGRSRGFGFVTFSDPKSVQEAITAMDGTQLDGKYIKVNEAQDRERRPPNNRYGNNQQNSW